MSEPRPNRRIQVVAVGFAAAALVTAVIAVIVVATRSAPELPPPPSGNVVEDRQVNASDLVKLDKNYDSKVWSMSTTGITVDDDALRKSLGLDPHDVITSLSGRALKRDMDVQRAIMDLMMLEAKTVYVEVTRDHRQLLYRWNIDGEIRDARRAARGGSRPGGMIGILGSGTGSATVAPDPLAPDPVVDALLTTVKVIDDNHLEVPRSTVDAVFANPMAFMHGARVVPAMTNGHPNGFKLYAIRPNSMFSALHFQNGDTIVSVNGEDLYTTGLDAYTRVKSAKQFVIDMVRRGSPLTMTIDIN